MEKIYKWLIGIFSVFILIGALNLFTQCDGYKLYVNRKQEIKTIYLKTVDTLNRIDTVKETIRIKSQNKIDTIMKYTPGKTDTVFSEVYKGDSADTNKSTVHTSQLNNAIVTNELFLRDSALLDKCETQLNICRNSNTLIAAKADTAINEDKKETVKVGLISAGIGMLVAGAGVLLLTR